MKRMMIIFFAAVLMAAGVSAQVPQTMSYQGVLKDAGGVTVPDDDYSFEFRLYISETEHSYVWTETQVIHVTSGLLNATLGAVNPIGLAFNRQYWLGISIDGGTELAPRTLLTGAPYALNAQQLRGGNNIVPSSGDVGLGTTSPSSNLHIYEDIDGTVGIDIENPNPGGSSTLRLGFNDEHGGLAGIIVRDDDNYWSQQMMIFNNRPGGNIAIGTMTGNIVLADTGNVGISQWIPQEKLDVNGAIKVGNTANTNEGAIRYTGTDFEGYVGSAWRSLTSSGGILPAGTSGQTLRHNGSGWVSSTLLYNAGYGIGINTTTPETTFHVNGVGQFGSSTISGVARVHMSGSPYTIAALSTNAYGGVLTLNDDDATLMCYMAGDGDGPGAGYFALYRDYPDLGFVVNGNWAGTAYPVVGMYGLSNFIFQGHIASGNTALVLPTSSVSDTEILDEPGVVSATSSTSYALDGTIQTLLSSTINAPTAGYVLVIGTVEGYVSHTTGITSQANFGVSDSPTAFPPNQDVDHSISSTSPSMACRFPVSVHGLFSVATGANTFYLLAEEENGGYTVSDMQLTAVFLPTAYGTVLPTLAASGDDDRPVQGASLSSGDIAAERRDSEAANTRRIEEELAELRAEVERLKSDMAREMPEKQ